MDKFFGDFCCWLKVHKLGCEFLFDDMYHWGYIKACEVIEAELCRYIEEYKDDTDRVRRHQDDVE